MTKKFTNVKMDTPSTGRHYAYSLKGTSTQELTEALPGSNPERWTHFNDHLIACHIAACIYRRTDDNKALPVGEFRVMANQLQDIVGRNGGPGYYQYLETLNALGIVKFFNEKGKGGKAGVVPKRYGFTRYQLDKGFNHELLVDRKVVKRMATQAKKQADECATNYESVHHALRQMVQKVIVPNYQEVLSNINLRKLKRNKDLSDAEIQYLQDAYELAIKTLDGTFSRHRAVLSRNNHRFYTFFTQIAKEVRYHARFNDALDISLREYDASCSQFWVLSILGLPKIQAFIAKRYPQHLELIITETQKLERYKEYHEFKALVLKGQFYEHVAGTLNNILQERYDKGLTKRKQQVTRDHIKAKSMKILFGRDKVTGTTKDGKKFTRYNNSLYMQAFKQDFCPIHYMLKRFRSQMGVSALAKMLQSIEAHVWIDGLSALLVDQKFDDFLSVHDCLVIKDLPKNVAKFDALCDYYFREVLQTEMPNIKSESVEDKLEKLIKGKLRA